MQALLIQFQLSGEWHTVATCNSMEKAIKRAQGERKAMHGARPVSIIRDGDSELLRRTADGVFLN